MICYSCIYYQEVLDMTTISCINSMFLIPYIGRELQAVVPDSP